MAPTIETDTASPPSYDKTVDVPLTAGYTFVRAGVYDSNGKLVANTQPIFFQSVNGMPGGRLDPCRLRHAG